MKWRSLARVGVLFPTSFTLHRLAPNAERKRWSSEWHCWRGTLSKRARSNEFALLTDEEAAARPFRWNGRTGRTFSRGGCCGRI